MVQTIITHDGVFHADEVFACAVMRVIHPEVKIIRTRDTHTLLEGKENKDTMLIDVGMEYDYSRRLYDHHQTEGAGQRKNGIPYSSFGLIWSSYGPMAIFCRYPELEDEQIQEAYQLVDDGLVSSVDVVDCNGLRVYKDTSSPLFTVSQVLSGFNGMQDGFSLAMEVAQSILDNEIRSAVTIVLKKANLFRNMSEQSGVPVLVIGDFFPGWQPLVTGSAYKRVVFQDLSGTWRVQIVPETSALPESWWGLSGEKLDKATGVKGGIFCHRGGFIAGHTTFEGALKMANQSIP